MFIAVYLLSPYFACALPCPSFTIISPDVILDYGIKTGILLFDTKQLFYYKTAWMRFCTTHTRFKVLSDYFRFVRVTSVLTPLASSFFSTSSALAFFECDYFFHLEIQSSILGYNS